MAEDFVGMNLAILVVSASIVLSGILIGVGRGLGYKKLEHFGIVELIQSMINAAIIGSFATIISLISEISSAVATAGCGEGNVVEQLSCSLTGLNDLLFEISQYLIKINDVVGFYQNLSMNFGSFEISPFTNLSMISLSLTVKSLIMEFVILLNQLNLQLLDVILNNALALIFPVGLVLRSFFGTRKLGGFLIALSLALFVVYPSFVLIFPSPIEQINETLPIYQNFTNNSVYMTMPVVDMNDNYAIAGKLDIMSGRCFEEEYYNDPNSSCPELLDEYGLAPEDKDKVDFIGDLTTIGFITNEVISSSLLYSIVAPLFSLIIVVVFTIEIASVVGGEITLGIFSKV